MGAFDLRVLAGRVSEPTSPCLQLQGQSATSPAACRTRGLNAPIESLFVLLQIIMAERQLSSQCWVAGCLDKGVFT